jgi:hypothetical protein
VAVAIGLIDAPGDRAALRQRFRVNEALRALPDDPTFARRLRAHLDAVAAEARAGGR